MSRLQRTRSTRACASILQFTVLALIWTTSTRITPLPSTITRTVDGFLVGTNPTKILRTTSSSSSSSCPSSERIALELSANKPTTSKMNEDEDHGRHHHHHDHDHHHHHHYDHHRIKKKKNVAKFKTFDEVLDRHHDETVLVCFEAFNCGPCRLMKKELEQLQTLLKREDEKMAKQTTTTKKNKGGEKMEEKEEEDEEEEEECVAAATSPQSSSPKSSSQAPAATSPLKIFRLDTERYPYLGVRYGIHRLPCLVFVKNHTVQLKLEGLNTADNIYQRFKNLRP